MSGNNYGSRETNKNLELFYYLIAQYYFGGGLEHILQMNSASLVPIAGKARVVGFPRLVIRKARRAVSGVSLTQLACSRYFLFFLLPLQRCVA